MHIRTHRLRAQPAPRPFRARPTLFGTRCRVARALIPATAVVLLAGCAAAPRTVTTRSLLSELTDLEGLAKYPDPPFICRQFSSFDRASTAPSDPDRWFANHDAGHFLRVEERDGRREHVLMDAFGPGAVVRIWSANPGGTLRVYLDGSDRPILEAPMSELLGGALPGVPRPIAGEYSRGWNSYLPIPYAQRCKITSDAGGFYYHVNYRTYPPGTPVVSLQPGEIETLSGELFSAARELAFPAVAPETLDTQRPGGRRIELAAGGTDEIELRGPKAIVLLAARLEGGGDDAAEALRRVLLRIRFDGRETVVAPLGDFFGAAPGINPYRSLPMGVREDGWMWCRWVMPFERSARVRLENHGNAPVTLATLLRTAAHRWTDRSMHFCAKWRRSRDVPTRPFIDWNYLSARGRGVFVGAAFHIANPVRAWWGEGDEKIYIDGEPFPSHFGTGTEDYYGYAWCSPRKFTHAFHNQPRCDGPDNYGHTAVNRWHIIDRIPFEQELRFDMELWHWTPDIKVDMAVVSYWYSSPGGSDRFAALTPRDLGVPALAPAPAIAAGHVLEGEKLRVIQADGRAEPQPIDGCSEGRHLWWHHELRPGHRLLIGFSPPAAGRYRVFVRCLRAPDYGTHQLSLNDRELGEPLDFYGENIAVGPEIELGVLALHEGENRLGVEALDARATAIKRYMFGLDYIRLEAAD